MQLSDDLQKRAAAVEQAPRYSGLDLGDKIVIGLEGPFATGKSTLTNKCIELLKEHGVTAGIIGTNTTRERRSNDPAHYVTDIDPKVLIEQGEKGKLINLTTFTTGHLYATSAESIPNQVNIGPLLPSALQKFKDAGCKEVYAFYLTTTPDQWRKQIDIDGRLAMPDIERRLDEAISSLTDAIKAIESDKDSLVLISNDGTRSIEELAGHILHKVGFEGFGHYERYPGHSLQEMYDYAVKLRQEVATT